MNYLFSLGYEEKISGYQLFLSTSDNFFRSTKVIGSYW